MKHFHMLQICAKKKKLIKKNNQKKAKFDNLSENFTTSTTHSGWETRFDFLRNISNVNRGGD